AVPRAALFLKTSDHHFKSYEFEKDDPFISSYGAAGIKVCRPDMPEGDDNPPQFVTREDIYGTGMSSHPFKEMEEIVRWVFLILESAWAMQGCALCDLKIEFGYTARGRLVVADVVDNDSWRLLNEKGEHLDKQRYRDKDTPLEVVAALYAEVASRAEKFAFIDEEEWFCP
ncbi:MAG: phosphoribosylaminoimidazolesuccinocarboxamide synthase, partial [Minisyncoccia bacterium]